MAAKIKLNSPTWDKKAEATKLFFQFRPPTIKIPAFIKVLVNMATKVSRRTEPILLRKKLISRSRPMVEKKRALRMSFKEKREW